MNNIRINIKCVSWLAFPCAVDCCKLCVFTCWIFVGALEVSVGGASLWKADPHGGEMMGGERE